MVLVEPSDARRPARAASTARLALPPLIVDAGPVAVARFLEFFAARIANRRTRAAYGARGAGPGYSWAWRRAPKQGLGRLTSAQVPAHHRAAAALDDYLARAGLDAATAALFQSVDPAGRRLTGRALSRRLVLAMIKRRAAAADLPPSTCCHTFRATGITAYLSNGGTLEHAQQIAGHASPKTTKLYDRTADTVTVDEIERIVI